MKTQIEKLIALAREYVSLGKEIGLPNAHNHLRESMVVNNPINIYFDNYGETWMVELWGVRIYGYSSKFEMPFDADENYLERVYNDARQYLDELKANDQALAKIYGAKSRKVRIRELTKELEKLQTAV